MRQQLEIFPRGITVVAQNFVKLPKLFGEEHRIAKFLATILKQFYGVSVIAVSNVDIRCLFIGLRIVGRKVNAVCSCCPAFSVSPFLR